MDQQQKPVIDQQWCHDWVSDKVFKLRPQDYCEKHPKWPGMVGIEVEMQPFWSSSIQSEKPAFVQLFGSPSLTQSLLELKSLRPEWKYQTFGSQGDHLLNIILEDGDQISFEPGGQLEISSRPFPCLDDAISRVAEVTAFLSEHLRHNGIQLFQLGFNPWFDTESLPLQMTKPRYLAMNDFFNQVGPYGKQMMRLTCTIQVNLDFGGDDATLSYRYLAANLISPIATAIFANSPFTNAQPNGFRSYRSRIWQGLDDSRTGFPDLETIAKKRNRAACVQAYLDRLLDAQVVYIERLNYQVMNGQLTFRQWIEQGFAGTKPTEDDFKTHLSLFFPEVRARGFMELRSVDVQSLVWQVVPACFFTALLYDEDNLRKIVERLPATYSEIHQLWRASSYGFQDERLRQIARELMELAVEGFERLPSCYQGKRAAKTFRAFAEHFTFQQRNPADDSLQAFRDSGNSRLSPATILKLEDQWRGIIEKS